MKFISVFQKTPLLVAVENNNLEIVRLLLSIKTIDINIQSIYISYFGLCFYL